MIKRTFSKRLILPLAGALLLALPVIAPAGNGNDDDSEILPQGKGHFTLDHKGEAKGLAKFNRPNSNLITYHGVPLISSSTSTPVAVTVYLIWYGNWSGNTATNILTDLVSNIGGSPYFNINT